MRVYSGPLMKPTYVALERVPTVYDNFLLRSCVDEDEIHNGNSSSARTIRQARAIPGSPARFGMYHHHTNTDSMDLIMLHPSSRSLFKIREESM
jgi:hypothetical protein